MTPDPASSKRAVSKLDDDALAGLVRATAEAWILPPQRLDAASWRDRAGASRARRRSWLPRLAAPVSAAIGVTVVVAFAAVWLNTPHPGQIAGASPSPSGAPATAPGPSESTPPNAAVNDPLAKPTTVLVRAGEAYKLADLTSGSFSAGVFGAFNGPATVIARPGGGWLCVCSDGGSGPGLPAHLTVTLALAGPTGLRESETPVRQLDGRADPGLPSPAQEQLVDAHATVSRDGRFAFLGWAVREGTTGWQLGVDVIDVAAARVVSSIGIPKLPSTTAAGQPTTRLAPAVDLAASGGRVLVSDFWFVNEDLNPSPSGVDHWEASFDGTTVSGLSPAGSTSGDACVETASGVVDASTWWVLCSNPDGRLRFDRFDRDGATIGSTDLPASDGLPAAQLDSRGEHLFVWGPVARALTRIDVATGLVSTVTATAAAETNDPLTDLATALGRWIAPTALAKVMLDPALAISPDGTRVYALGVDMHSGEAVSSLGIFVFDTATMAQVGHWQPAADLTSIALSPDGAWLYAAGQPLFDAAGNAIPGCRIDHRLFDGRRQREPDGRPSRERPHLVPWPGPALTVGDQPSRSRRYAAARLTCSNPRPSYRPSAPLAFSESTPSIPSVIPTARKRSSEAAVIARARPRRRHGRRTLMCSSQPRLTPSFSFSSGQIQFWTTPAIWSPSQATTHRSVSSSGRAKVEV